jgi:hypothetical protein
MTSQGNRSISKASAAPSWTKLTAFVLAGQVSQCDMNSIRHGNAARYRTNNSLTVLTTRPIGAAVNQSYKPCPSRNQGFPITRDLALRNTRNNGQPNRLPPNNMAGIPTGSSSLDTGLSGPCRGRRWRRVPPHQVSRAG